MQPLCNGKQSWRRATVQQLVDNSLGAQIEVTGSGVKAANRVV